MQLSFQSVAGEIPLCKARGTRAPVFVSVRVRSPDPAVVPFVSGAVAAEGRWSGGLRCVIGACAGPGGCGGGFAGMRIRPGPVGAKTEMRFSDAEYAPVFSERRERPRLSVSSLSGRRNARTKSLRACSARMPRTGAREKSPEKAAATFLVARLFPDSVSVSAGIVLRPRCGACAMFGAGLVRRIRRAVSGCGSPPGKILGPRLCVPVGADVSAGGVVVCLSLIHI